MGKKAKKPKAKDDAEERSNDAQLQAIFDSVLLKMNADMISAELTRTDWASIAGLLNRQEDKTDIRWKAAEKLYDALHAKGGLVLYKEEINDDHKSEGGKLWHKQSR